MSEIEFKCISSLLKERIDAFKYEDLYPNISEDKIKSIFAPCPFWREHTPSDTMGQNWFYIQFIPVEIKGNPINLAVQTYSSRFIVHKYSDMGDLVEQHASSSGKTFFAKEIGIDHQILFDGLKDIIIDCLKDTNK